MKGTFTRAALALAFVCTLLASLRAQGQSSKSQTEVAIRDGAPSIVIQWNNAALQGVRDSKLGPPMVARALAIVHTCIYDAWAAYDEHALGTQLGGKLRQPPSQRRIFSQEEAISLRHIALSWTSSPGTRQRFLIP
jgi:hypothetical protein